MSHRPSDPDPFLPREPDADADSKSHDAMDAFVGAAAGNAAEWDAAETDALSAALSAALWAADAAAPVPPGLAGRVLAGLRVREERALDSLLELAELGGDTPPVGLPDRVLAAVRAVSVGGPLGVGRPVGGTPVDRGLARGAASDEVPADGVPRLGVPPIGVPPIGVPRHGWRVLRGGSSRVRTAALAAAVFLGAATLWTFRGAQTPGGSQEPVALVPPRSDAAVEAEVLELLPLLERWDLLTEGEGNLDPADLETLAVLGEEDELLLLLEAEENG
jgi:hypothetical protein